ncbi:MAG: sigma factor-like helix-turn-helix DNA-binding protein [Chthoniobacterales bacterium]
MDCHRIGSLTCTLDASERNEVLSLLVQCLAQLPQMPKKVLAMYYDENLQLAEIATEFGLTEYEVDQLRAKTLGILQTMLITQLGDAKPQNRRASSP